MRKLIYFALVLLLGAACVTPYMKRPSVERRLDQLRRLNKPIGIFASRSVVNSVGGTGVNLEYINLSNKTIKYLNFYAKPYNAVGDAVSSEIGRGVIAAGQDTGPVLPGGSGGGLWPTLWYNATISCVVLTSVNVIFTDNTSVTIQDVESIFLPPPGQDYTGKLKYNTCPRPEESEN